MKANSTETITSKAEIKISRELDTSNINHGSVKIKLARNTEFCVPDILTYLQNLYQTKGFGIACFSLCMLKPTKLVVQFRVM